MDNNLSNNDVFSWEPLPPRSTNRKRRGRINNDNNNNDKTHEENKDTNKRTGRNRNRNRPGFNSYLKVELDDDTMKRLHNLTLDIQAKFQQQQEQEQEQNADEVNANEITTTNQKLIEANDRPVTTTFKDSIINNIESFKSKEAIAMSNTDISKSVEEEMIKNNNDKDGNNNTESKNNDNKNNSDNNKKCPPLRIKPRSLNSLHMTFFFGGETICELTDIELIAWYQDITKRLQQSGFVINKGQQNDKNNDNNNDNDKASNGNNNKNDNVKNLNNNNKNADEVTTDDNNLSVTTSDTGTTKSSDYWFRIKQVCTFPPRRNNLIVAILEASPLWHELHDDIRSIAQNCTYSNALQDVTKYSKDKWTPHITLANLIPSGPKKLTKVSTQVLNEILLETTKSLDHNDNNDTEQQNDSSLYCSPSCIAMGGPIPEQVELDWNFHFHDDKHTSSDMNNDNKK